MKTTLLFFALLLSAVTSKAQLGGGQLQIFPTVNARMEANPVFNSDSSQSTPETIIIVLMSDTTNMKQLHLQLKSRANGQLQSQQSRMLNPADLWEKFSGTGTRLGYEIAVKLSGDHTQERLEVELENRSGSRSPKFILP
jgi:hypothetical protein